MVVIGHRDCIPAKKVKFMTSGGILEKWLNSGKSCFIRQSGCIRAKVFLLGQSG